MSIFSQHRSTISVLTGLDSEANEWVAINKLELIQEMESKQENRIRDLERKAKFRSELAEQSRNKKEKTIELKNDNYEFAKMVQINE